MFFLRLLSRLPLPVLYLLSDFLFLLTYYIIGYRRKVILDNLDLSFPEKTAAERQKIMRGFYHSLCDVIVESLKGPTISKDEILRRTKVLNPEVLTDIYDAGQSVIILTTHQGNWEWLLLGCSAWLPFDICALYQPLSNKFFDKLMFDIRSRFGAQMIPGKQILREVARRRKIVSLYALVADQSPPKEGAYKTMFLNQPTLFLTGGEKIAKAANFDVVFVSTRRIRRGYYEIEFTKIGSPPYGPDSAITEEYARLTEKMIRRDPSGWLWSHKRWKHKVSMDVNHETGERTFA
ncbi:MAG: lysophospholipid acyltransferase family protein [Bacteroidota bacterium]